MCESLTGKDFDNFDTGGIRSIFVSCKWTESLLFSKILTIMINEFSKFD